MTTTSAKAARTNAAPTLEGEPSDGRPPSCDLQPGDLQPGDPQSGDKAPFFYGMRAEGAYHSSEDQIGVPTVLILGARRSPSVLVSWLEAFMAQINAIAPLSCDVLLLVSPDPRWMSVSTPVAGSMLLHCPSEELFASSGCDSERPTVLLLDRTLRIAARLERSDASEAGLALSTRLKTWRRETPSTVAASAPVLIVPNLIDAALCDLLIAHFEASAHVDGAMASVDPSGQAVNRLDAEKKHRRDCTLEIDSSLHRRMIDVLERRLLPDIKRAFQANVTHIDRILIARYDESGGYFRRHRDNSAPQTAFRQFALSMNLNTDAYEGGDLRFPEFNDHPHRPPAGAACVFSASLLHEATPVTRGRRYVLLTFFHDDQAETARRR